jgi:hypothetical protein
MKSKRFTEEQIIAVLKEAEAGAKTKDMVRLTEAGIQAFMIRLSRPGLFSNVRRGIGTSRSTHADIVTCWHAR